MRSLCLSLLLLAASAAAQSVRMVVQSSPLAGFQYHEAAALWQQLRVGDALELAREPQNPHDAKAVSVAWRGHKLGYLPRRDNAAVAAEMDAGARVAARIERLQQAADPWARLRVEVFVEL